MPSFVHTALLWGLPLVGLPVLIHLINMLRHRRVEWAAMEFLLASERRNRTRVLLRQLFLLLLRAMAIAAIVFMLAQPRVTGGLGRLLGGGTIHRVVLLDDSYSMNDRWGDTTGFQRAKRVVAEVAARARNEGGRTLLTVLRYSQADRAGEGPKPDLLELPLNDDTTRRIDDILQTVHHSQTAAGPREALAAAATLVAQSKADQHIVYVVSDFRRREWAEVSDRADSLESIRASGGRLQLIDCVDGARPNVSVARLDVVSGIRATDVPIAFEVEIVNHHFAAIENAALFLFANDVALAPIAIDRIEPRQSTRRRFSVTFATPGAHVVAASVERDAVEDDNTAYAVVDVADRVAVLLVEGDPKQRSALYLSAALAPVGQTQTGVRIQTESSSFVASQSLDPFQTIYLLDVEHLERAAIDKLERFVRSGGGLCVFLGPRGDVRHINMDWVRGGEGFFPVALAGQDVLMADPLRGRPDVEVKPHPIFSVFVGEGGSFLSTVAVERFMAVADPSEAAHAERFDVIGTLRNGSPWVIENTFGKGRVVTFLSTAAPEWNNWARGNPSFVVCMLELQSYLLSHSGDAREVVGQPLVYEYDNGRFEPRVQFLVPTATAGAAKVEVDSARVEDGRLRASLGPTVRAGIYRVELTVSDGAIVTRPLAVNVDAAEGDLDRVDSRHLAGLMPADLVQFHRADEYETNGSPLFERKLAGPLLQTLILLLLVEQAVAYWAGYHQGNGRSQGFGLGSPKGGGR